MKMVFIPLSFPHHSPRELLISPIQETQGYADMKINVLPAEKGKVKERRIGGRRERQPVGEREE